jgi:5-methylcytosine-specific restriction endonuclease McrA
MSSIKKIYGKDWPLIAIQIKTEAKWKCEECGAPQSLEKGHRLTVHHKDGNPKNNTRTNLECLCQRCHLRKHKFIQARYIFNQKEVLGQTSILPAMVEDVKKYPVKDE